MASTSRTEDAGLEASPVTVALEHQPYQFEFFQAVRLLERFSPKRAPVGFFGDPSSEVVRFAAHASQAFPASQIQALIVGGGSRPPRMVVNFFGLIGPSGYLPLFYTELLIDRIRAGDTAACDFLDIFNHRMLSLFCRAWQKYRFPIAYERGESDRLTAHLLEFIGLGTAGLRDRQAVEDKALLYYAGLFAEHNRSAVALEQMVSDYFGVDAVIEQFIGAWYTVAAGSRCCLGERATRSEQLGYGALVGDAVYDRHARVRIRLGPLDFTQYNSFLPGGGARRELEAIARFFTNGELEAEVQPVLRREEVPPCALDGGDDETLPRLGWSTWMKSAPFSRDPDETILPLC
jgi:type VI secretion system protein ImpH